MYSNVNPNMDNTYYTTIRLQLHEEKTNKKTKIKTVTTDDKMRKAQI